MKIIKRIFISITRNYAQSILMFLIVFVLGNVLFASIAVDQSSETVKKELRQRASSGIVVYLKTYGASNFTKNLENLYDRLSEEESVTSLYYQPSITVYEYFDNGYFTVNEFNGISPGYEGVFDYTITEGRFYTQDEIDNGEYKIVLSEYDGYKVGDIYRIYIPDYYSEEEIMEIDENHYYSYLNIYPKTDNLRYIDLEVIGLYSDKRIKERYKEFNDVPMTYYDQIPSKVIEDYRTIQNEVINNHSANERNTANSYGMYYYEASYGINSIEIKTTGIDATDEIEQMILTEGKIPTRYGVKSSSQEYRYIQGPLENLVALADVVVVASALLIILLMSLITNLFIKYRLKEIGILMSIGEKKIKIITQFVGEILLVGMIATSSSMVSGAYLGEVVSNKFMEIQVDVDSEMDYREENEGALTQIDLLETYKVEINSEYIVTIYFTSLMLLVISSFLPMSNILKTKPKDILL